MFLALLSVEATAKALSWTRGVVILRDETVRVGELSPQGTEVVLFRDQQGTVSVYAAHRVHSFRYYDAQENINRVFVSRTPTGSHTGTCQFYESVITGFVSVFRKARPNAAKPDDFVYYIAWNDRWLTLTRFRQEVFPFFRQQSRALPGLKSGLAALNPNEKDEALKMIILFNRTYASTSLAGI